MGRRKIQLKPTFACFAACAKAAIASRIAAVLNDSLDLQLCADRTFRIAAKKGPTVSKPKRIADLRSTQANIS